MPRVGGRAGSGLSCGRVGGLDNNLGLGFGVGLSLGACCPRLRFGVGCSGTRQLALRFEEAAGRRGRTRGLGSTSRLQGHRSTATRRNLDSDEKQRKRKGKGQEEKA